jgi:ABC-2 type transport system permease protein
VLSGVNWGGLKTLYIKEVRRFFKVQLQTVWAAMECWHGFSV